MQAFNAAAVIAGLCSAISFGISDFFVANASRKISPLLVTIFVMLFTAVSFSLIYVFGLSHQQPWLIEGVLFAAAAGLIMTLAVSAFYRGLSIGTVSIVSPIGAAYPLVTTLTVVAFFHAHLQLSEALGIIITVIGVMVTGGLLSMKHRELKLDTGVAMALIACIAWGIMFALLGKAVSIIGWEKGTLVEVWFMVIGCLAILPFIKTSELLGRQGLNILTNWYVLGGALLQTTGVVALNVGFTRSTSTAVETTVSACYPILTVILALIFFKEKINWVTKTGIATTIIGVAILSYH